MTPRSWEKCVWVWIDAFWRKIKWRRIMGAASRRNERCQNYRNESRRGPGTAESWTFKTYLRYLIQHHLSMWNQPLQLTCLERRSLLEKIAHLSMRLFPRIYGLFLPTCVLVKTLLLKHKKQCSYVVSYQDPFFMLLLLFSALVLFNEHYDSIIIASIVIITVTPF